MAGRRKDNDDGKCNGNGKCDGNCKSEQQVPHTSAKGADGFGMTAQRQGRKNGEASLAVTKRWLATALHISRRRCGDGGMTSGERLRQRQIRPARRRRYIRRQPNTTGAGRRGGRPLGYARDDLRRVATQARKRSRRARSRQRRVRSLRASSSAASRPKKASRHPG